jgi:tetratricopeptide (TPR) repeat protein
MRARIFLMTGILLGICSSLALAEPPKQGGGADAGIVESYEKAISGAKDEEEEALSRKKLGDFYASQGDYKRAAEEFVKALSPNMSTFTRQERLQMAISISWADRLDDAVRVLRSVLAEDQKDRDARIQLAEVLSLSDRLNEAEAEADTVLNEYPENQEALLVKANVLRWRGDAKASVPVYEKALAQGENFDARIGLANAYLDIGEKGTAKEISETLKPQSSVQEKKLATFSDVLCGDRASFLGMRYSYYKDSDDNTVKRSALSYGFWAGSWETALTYQLTDAKDPARNNKAEDLLITTHAQAGRLGIGAGVGIVRTEGGAGGILTGQVRADAGMEWGTVNVSASREVFSDTAQLIENGIVRTSGTLSLSEILSPRLTFSESYTYSGYSDSNNADDLQLGARYTVTLDPLKIATGYRFRYWNFRRQSGSGYFDPEGFTSHQVFISFYTEKNGFYAYLEPYAGYQSFTRYDEKSGDTFSGVFGSAGWKMKKCTSFEINGEGGNYAGGTTAGFNYSLIGFRLIMNF